MAPVLVASSVGNHCNCLSAERFIIVVSVRMFQGRRAIGVAVVGKPLALQP